MDGYTGGSVGVAPNGPAGQPSGQRGSGPGNYRLSGSLLARGAHPLPLADELGEPDLDETVEAGHVGQSLGGRRSRVVDGGETRLGLVGEDAVDRAVAHHEGVPVAGQLVAVAAASRLREATDD